ncbi:MAG: saccharopine dehydrogenase C-terminal domain-containing protein [Methylacidiphilales bacterium]|nr:saccharopine dehydrogenase C-terminal domain-containing protein [Candidatus Methylacidiphilales bacterium]
MVRLKIDGGIILIGFGAVGRGLLPLLERHFIFDPNNVTIISPNNSTLLEDLRGKYTYLDIGLVEENYQSILSPILSKGTMVINVSVDVSSVAIMELCEKYCAHYIDTVIEPWSGFYFNQSSPQHERTNYALRKTMLEFKNKHPMIATQVSCCGANPGMVSWFIKKALLTIAHDTQKSTSIPKSRRDWAQLMESLGVKGIHIAEHDSQKTNKVRPSKSFWNTWSVDGLLSEGMQPAELGWGTHEINFPTRGKRHPDKKACAIYLGRPGANTRVLTWCPSVGAQFGLLVTHNESISVSDYYTCENDSGEVRYRPTVHYAYSPCEDAWMSLSHLFANPGWFPDDKKVIDENSIISGADQLGVLLFGHKKNAYWYGSTLTHQQATEAAPQQSATVLQVTSSIVAGISWILTNPNSGVVETDEMDFSYCLEVQKSYLGDISGHYTDWTPLHNRPFLFDELLDTTDPWQFTNVLVDNN